jgi:hypothetical protein
MGLTGSGSRFTPTNESGVESDNRNDIGTSDYRFKNLYLSGGVYANNASGAFLWNAENSHIAFGTNNTERMRIDGSGNVGIGISNPSDYYTNFNDLVLGNTSAASGMTIASGTSHDGTIAFADGTVGNAEYQGYMQYNHGTNSLTFGTAGTNRMRIDSAGNVTKPSQPAFCCKPSSVQSNMATGGVTIAFGSELFDIGANFASNTFTAPVTGKYFLNFSARLDQVPTNPNYIEVKIITSNNTFHWLFDPDGFDSSPTYFNAQNSVVCDMDSGDTAYISFNQNGGTAQVDCSTESHFSGYLAC